GYPMYLPSLVLSVIFWKILRYFAYFKLEYRKLAVKILTVHYEMSAHEILKEFSQRIRIQATRGGFILLKRQLSFLAHHGDVRRGHDSDFHPIRARLQDLDLDIGPNQDSLAGPAADQQHGASLSPQVRACWCE